MLSRHSPKHLAISRLVFHLDYGSRCVLVLKSALSWAVYRHRAYLLRANQRCHNFQVVFVASAYFAK